MRMGLGFCIVLSDLLLCCFVGSYRIFWLDCIGWIVLLDRIGCIGWIGWIGSAGWGHIVLCIGWLLKRWDGWNGWGVGVNGVGKTVVSACRNGSAITGAPPLSLEGSWCDGLLLPTWYGWTVWVIGGTGVVQTKVSTRRNGSATISSGKGAPPLALEGRRAMQSGSWHQFCWCFKDAEYLCRRSKIIQIECAQIQTSNVVQYSINSTYDTIILWLNTTLNCSYNLIVPKQKS